MTKVPDTARSVGPYDRDIGGGKVMRWEPDQQEPNITTVGRLYPTPSISGPQNTYDDTGHNIEDAVLPDPPVAGGNLSDQTFDDNTGIQTYDVSFDFTGVDLIYSVQTGPAGVSVISSTGVVRFDTNLLSPQSNTAIVIRAQNSGGFADSAFNLNIAEVDAAPVIQGQPTINNTTPVVGDVVTASPAAVTGRPTPSRSWQWRRGATLVGTDSASYTVTLADEGSTLTIEQVETNPLGTDQATSAATSAVVHVPPTSGGNLLDQVFVEDTGLETYDVSFDFTGEALTYSMQTGPAGVTVNQTTGVVTFDTDLLNPQSNTTVVIRAQNSGGFANSAFSLTITENVGAPVLTITDADDPNDTWTATADQDGTLYMATLTSAVPPTLSGGVFSGANVVEQATLGAYTTPGPAVLTADYTEASEACRWLVFGIENGNGTDVEVVTFMPNLAPAQMIAPSLVVDGTDSITATLGPPPEGYENGIDSYDLRYQVDAGAWTTVTGVTSPYAITGLDPDTLYNVQTRAVNVDGAGVWSPSASATTDADVPVGGTCVFVQSVYDPNQQSASVPVTYAGMNFQTGLNLVFALVNYFDGVGAGLTAVSVGGVPASYNVLYEGTVNENVQGRRTVVFVVDVPAGGVQDLQLTYGKATYQAEVSLFHLSAPATFVAASELTALTSNAYSFNIDVTGPAGVVLLIASNSFNADPWTTPVGVEENTRGGAAFGYIYIGSQDELPNEVGRPVSIGVTTSWGETYAACISLAVG